MNIIKLLSGLLILSGLFLAIFTLGRSVYYSPNSSSEDSGLTTSALAEGSQITSVSMEEYPSRLLVPKLNIDTRIQHLGITKSGNMAAPNNFTDVSWYKFGTVPGYRGSAVMAGHEDNGLALDGVFKHLEDLEIGDSIYVVRMDGKQLHFKVVDIEVYPYDFSPLEKIFNSSDSTRLNLITCAGNWLPQAKTNDKRLVIYTELAG